ncbi:MAG: sn-glycerol-1-phosphate dehydrogenase [Spirochaetota bacterium]
MDTLVNECGPEALGNLGAICDRLGGEKALLIVSDERIWKAEGAELRRALAARKDEAGYFILPGDPPPYADDSLVATVREALRAQDCLALAFGGGTINDAVKRAAFELGRPYVCVPTAPSVDGYTSYGASITVGGFKMTLECSAPIAIVADPALLARAPGELIASGFGDLAAKVVAGVDWMIADAIGVDRIDQAVFDMVQPFAMGILGKGAKVRSHEAAAIGELYQGLAASGLAMQRYRDSRPASGAEHLMSHVWEMAHLRHRGELVSHGFKVAVGTLASVALQRRMLLMSGKELELAAAEAGDEFLDERIAAAKASIPANAGLDRAIEAIGAKTLGGSKLAERRATILATWDDLRSRALARLPTFDSLRRSLLEAGCPTHPSDIGLGREDYKRGILVAALIRKRYTILDLASEFGLLEDFAEEEALREFPVLAHPVENDTTAL